MNQNQSDLYDHYNTMGDAELNEIMRTTIGVLQMSNQEDLSMALTAFVDRYKGIAKEFNELLYKEYMRNDYHTKG